MNDSNSPPLPRAAVITILVAGIAVAGNWIADATEKMVMLVLALFANEPLDENKFQLADFLFIVLSLVILGGSLAALYHRRRELFGAHVTSFTLARNTPRPCLIFLVSPQRLKDRDSGAWRDRLQRDPCGGYYIDQPANKLSGHLDDDARNITQFKLAPQWPWQQILRGLSPHLGPTLQRVWLIGSRGPDGSEPELDLLAELLRWYGLGDKVVIDPDRSRDGGLNFEDFAALKDRLRAVMDEELRRAGSRDESRIVINATGGHKTTSIAAASVTLNSTAVFQYVQTVPNYDVLTYDIVFESRDMHE